MNKLLNIILGATAALASLPAQATVEPFAPERLVAEADLVAVATVEDQLTKPTRRGLPHFVTEHTLTLDEVLVSDDDPLAAGDQVFLRTAGGSGPNRQGKAQVLTEFVPEAPELEVGDQVLIFLYRVTDGRDLHLSRDEVKEPLEAEAYGPLGWQQGVLQIDSLTNHVVPWDVPLDDAVDFIHFNLSAD
jgi:hypothetical protein